MHNFKRMSKASCKLWGYLTDVEGHAGFWNGYLSISKVLFRDPESGEVKLRDNSGFVFGGDSVDKGTYDIRFVKELLNLKKNNPDRVVFLIGNRDANKLRFHSELHDEFIKNFPVDQTPAYWIPDDKKVSIQQYLQKNNLEDTKINRLKFMLFETMGSQTTFELRRTELQQILNKDDVSDEEVYQSFVTSVDPNHPENIMLQYLKEGQLMFRLGENLFVHGGFAENTLGTVPGEDTIRENVDDWEKDLNQWCNKEYNNFLKQPLFQNFTSIEKRGERGGDYLLDYGVPGGNNNKTVVYSTFINNGRPVPLSDAVVSYLNKSGIKRVLVGHQPVGQCPTVINQDSVQTILADTSYCNMAHPDSRGPTVNEVLIDTEDQSVEVHGILNDGQKIHYKISLPSAQQNANDPFVGKLLKNNYWVKAKLTETPEDGKNYLGYYGEGFRCFYAWFSPDEIQSNL